MPKFIVRVQLPGEPTGTVYDSLHEQMEARQFARTDEIGEKRYHLPHGEYVTTKARSAEQALQLAREAALAAKQAEAALYVNESVHTEQFLLLEATGLSLAEALRTVPKSQ